MTHAATCAIALGSNLGDSRRILQQALAQLSQWPGVDLGLCSSWYETLPIGPPQPNYFNGCVILKTTLAPLALLDALQAIEAKFGRMRHQRNGPRTLDLDLLLVETQVITMSRLQVPHPRMNDRAFVLMPLAEIAPNWVEPCSGKTIYTLAQTVDTSGIVQKLTPDWECFR